jgi:hypothetical protein
MRITAIYYYLFIVWNKWWYRGYINSSDKGLFARQYIPANSFICSSETYKMKDPLIDQASFNADRNITSTDFYRTLLKFQVDYLDPTRINDLINCRIIPFNLTSAIETIKPVAQDQELTQSLGIAYWLNRAKNDSSYRNLPGYYLFLSEFIESYPSYAKDLTETLNIAKFAMKKLYNGLELIVPDTLDLEEFDLIYQDNEDKLKYRFGHLDRVSVSEWEYKGLVEVVRTYYVYDSNSD